MVLDHVGAGKIINAIHTKHIISLLQHNPECVIALISHRFVSEYNYLLMNDTSHVYSVVMILRCVSEISFNFQ